MLENQEELKVNIASEFQMETEELKEFDVIIWEYIYENYSGDAFLLLENKETKELFEVNGSHCSCYGLENQFCLEPTTKEELKFRLDNNEDYGTINDYGTLEFREQLVQFLGGKE